MNILLKPSPEMSPKIPACRREKPEDRGPSKGSWEATQIIPFPFSSTSFFTGICPLNSKAMCGWSLASLGRLVP